MVSADRAEVSVMLSLIPLPRAVQVLTLAGISNRAPLGGTLGWALLVAAVYASDAGPPVPAMAFTAAALFPAAAWVTSALHASLSDDLRSILVAGCGRTRALLIDTCAPLLWVAAIALTGVIACRALDPHPPRLSQCGIGAALHLLSGTCGVALGLLVRAGRLTRGATTLAITAATVLSLVVSHVPPLGPELATWGGSDHVAADDVVWSIAETLALLSVLTWWAAMLRRRRS
jgi:hypothetical protein